MNCYSIHILEISKTIQYFSYKSITYEKICSRVSYRNFLPNFKFKKGKFLMSNVNLRPQILIQSGHTKIFAVE